MLILHILLAWERNDFNSIFIHSIFSKSHQVGTFDPKDLPKTLHLLDDSELEDSSRNLHLLHAELPSPTIDLPLQASQNTAENSMLLTRYKVQHLFQLILKRNFHEMIYLVVNKF